MLLNPDTGFTLNLLQNSVLRLVYYTWSLKTIHPQTDPH